MDWNELGKQLITTLAFSGMGLAVFSVAFFIMEVITPFSIRKELEEKGNNSIAIVLGSVIVGISLIIMGALMGES